MIIEDWVRVVEIYHPSVEALWRLYTKTGVIKNVEERKEMARGEDGEAVDGMVRSS